MKKRIVVILFLLIFVLATPLFAFACAPNNDAYIVSIDAEIRENLILRVDEVFSVNDIIITAILSNDEEQIILPGNQGLVFNWNAVSEYFNNLTERRLVRAGEFTVEITFMYPHFEFTLDVTVIEA